MKSKSLSFILILGLFLSCKKKDDGLIFRNIGHTLLLHSGDSTSRVLPIEYLGDNTFLIGFESAFKLNPDTLINIVHRHLVKYAPEKDYRVSVLDCQKKSLVYGYEVLKIKDFGIPCTGRVYPKACYKIQIQLLEDKFPWKILLCFLAIFLLVFSYFFFRKKSPKLPENPNFISIGAFRFFAETKILEFEKEHILLSEKETKLLLLFSKKLNQIIDRDILLKEVWENDGVFVISRNLDVLVSKLRKKLHNDSNIKIINSHGKGYGLEVYD